MTWDCYCDQCCGIAEPADPYDDPSYVTWLEDEAVKQAHTVTPPDNLT